MRRGYTGPGTNKPTASVSKIRPGRAGAAPAGGPRGRSLRRSRTPPRTPQAAALPARADHAAPITHRRLSTTRRRGGDVARRGEQRPGVDEKGTASVPSCRDLVSPCPHVLMSSCPPVLLSSCPPVLLSSCPHVLVSPCPRVLVEYCYIDGGNGPGAGGRYIDGGNGPPVRVAAVTSVRRGLWGMVRTENARLGFALLVPSLPVGVRTAKNHLILDPGSRSNLPMYRPGSRSNLPMYRPEESSDS